ncbi:flagellar protein FliT [Pseudomonas sp. URMO17WK12:I4]|uniref:flagellar protein FliT n=1 Tax=Pseudomonas sp. URMO17WK12:I4 TaxID=1283292 RepID=UPI00047F821E|nr:flagellar protein FliT [Pseudomonas sp. URMO17WK12:I4]
MTNSVRLLQDTGIAIRQALLAQDWVAIGELDLQCRQAVEEAMVDAVEEESLRERLQDLLVLYRELVTACQDERQRVADELQQINQAQKGAKVYQLYG